MKHRPEVDSRAFHQEVDSGPFEQEGGPPVRFPAPLGGELFLDQILAAASMVDRELASQAEVI